LELVPGITYAKVIFGGRENEQVGGEGMAIKRVALG
jgi:hypothetical protein